MLGPVAARTIPYRTNMSGKSKRAAHCCVIYLFPHVSQLEEKDPKIKFIATILTFYFIMRCIIVKIKLHASFLDSGLLRSNKDDCLITRHSPQGIFSSSTH